MMQDDQTEQLIDGGDEEQQQQEQAAAPAADEQAAPGRRRSGSWLQRFGKSVATTAKKIGKDIGDGTKKLGKQIGDGTKKVFAKKEPAAAAAAAEEEGDASAGAAPAGAEAGGAEAGAEASITVAPANKRPKFPATGMRAATPYGEGVIAVLEDGRAVVHLDWCLADGQPARAYLAADLLRRPVPKFMQGAGKVMHKVGDAIAGDNGIFGKNTWAKVGDGMKKAGAAIKTTADKATHGVKEAFKKKPAADGAAGGADLAAPLAADAAAPAAATEEPEAQQEVANPYAAPAANE